MKVIYLDIDEEITAVIDKMKKVPENDLVLVIPKRAILTQSLVNLKLLKKQADLINKNVRVVVSEKVAYNLSERAGLEVSNQIPESKKDFIPKKAPLKTEAEQKPLKFNSPKIHNYLYAEEKKEELKKKTEKSEKKKWRPKSRSEKTKFKEKKQVVFLPKIGVKVFLIFFSISLIIAGIIFFLLLPKVVITVNPKTEQYTTGLDVVIEKNIPEIDLTNSRIPGDVVFDEEVSPKKQFETKGIKEIGDHSKGDVIISNKFSSSSQPLMANTRFQADNGKIYRLRAETSVPGATIENGQALPGKLKVTLEAEEAGEEYNLTKSHFVIPGLPQNKQNSIYADSAGEFTGGAKKKMRVLSEEDLNLAKNGLSKQAFEGAVEKLKTKAPVNRVFFDSALKKEIIETKTNHDVGIEATDFELEIKVRVSTLVFKESDLSALIQARTEKAENFEKGIVNPGVKEGVKAELLNFDFESGKMGLKIQVDKKIAFKVDTAKIKREVKGHDELWIKDYLAKNPNLKSSQVKFWPFWVKKAPNIEKKVEVKLDII